MGISGAALATVISRSFTFSVALYVLAIREDMIPCSASTVKEIFHSWRAILHIGIPTSLARLVLPLTTGIIVRFLSYYGAAAVAAYGVATRIEFFGMTVIIAVSSVLAPFVGQNRGAKLFDRIRRGIWSGKIFALSWGIGFGLIVIVAARPIALFFNDDPTYLSVLISYLRIVPITYGMHGILLICVAALNVLKKPFLAAAMVAGEMFVLCIPLAWLFSYPFGPTGIFSAISISFLLAGIGGHFVLKKIINQEEEAVLRQETEVQAANA
jgi:Na+-driven multidrug efflux pump